MKLRFSKRRLAVGTVLFACVVLLLFRMSLGTTGEIRTQRLPDGSLLVLTRAEFGPTNEFVHGNQWERLLGNAIPSNGFRFSRFKLQRPTKLTFSMSGQPWLNLEFKQVYPRTNTLAQRVASSGSYRQYRCLVGGETGIEYAEDFWPGWLKNYSDGCFGYVLSSRFPRDSKWVTLRVEQQITRGGLGVG